MKLCKKLLLAALVLSVMLAVCACKKDMSGSEYCGTWDAVTATDQDGHNVSVDDTCGKFTVVLNEDGTAAMANDNMNVESSDWKETSSGVKLGNVELTADNGNLYYYEDDITYMFEKEK